MSIRLGNGNVEARATLAAGGFIDVTIGTGNTDLFIPVNTSAIFSAVVGNGNIEISDLELQNLARTDKTIMGVLGDGDGAITVRTGTGRITASGF